MAHDERVEAAAKWKAVAMYDGPQHDPKYWAVVDGDGRKVFDTLNADSRWTTDEQEQMAKRCVAALTTADSASGERVVWTNNGKSMECFTPGYVGAEPAFSVEPDEELVVRKVRGT